MDLEIAMISSFWYSQVNFLRSRGHPDMIKLEKRTLTPLAILAVVIGSAILLFCKLGLFEFFADKSRLFNFIEQHRAYAVFIFIGLQMLQVIVAILPGEVTGFVSGMLFGPVWGVILSTIGLALGSLIAFNLARLIGRPLVNILASEETIKRYDYVMKHKGIFLAFLMFLIPGFPKDILCYLLGLGHMRQVDFLIVSTLGRLFGTTLLTIGGAYFREERYGAFFIVLGIGIAGLIVVLIYREKIERWIRRMHAVQRLRSVAKKGRLKKKKEP